MKFEMQNVPKDLKIFLSSPYFLCHTVWISLTDSFQKEQKNINVAFSYGRLYWCGVISDGIDVYSIWQYSFPLIDQFTVSWHPIKVFFLYCLTPCRFHQNSRKVSKWMWIAVYLGRIRNKKLKDFQELFEVFLKVWGISAASLCCCTYAVLIAEGKKLTTGQICYLNYLSLSNPYPFLTHGAMA